MSFFHIFWNSLCSTGVENIENRRITRIIMQSLPTQRYRRQAVRDNLDIVGELLPSCLLCDAVIFKNPFLTFCFSFDWWNYGAISRCEHLKCRWISLLLHHSPIETPHLIEYYEFGKYLNESMFRFDLLWLCTTNVKSLKQYHMGSFQIKWQNECILSCGIVAIYLKYWLNWKTPKWNIVSKVSDYFAKSNV